MKRLFFILLAFCLSFNLSLAQEKLTLQKSIAIAFEKSPVILKTKADIVAAEGVAGQAVAGFLPQVSLKGGLGKYYSEPMTVQMTMMGSPSVFSYGTDEQADMYNYSASVSQAVFTGGRLLSSLGMASKGLEAAKEEYRKVTQQVEFEVIRAYYTVLKARKMVELSDQSVTMAQNHLNQVKSLFNAGMSTRAHILRGEVQLAQAEIGATKAKQGLEIAKNHFNNTIGRELGAAVDLEEIEYDSKKEIPIYNYADLLKIAYEDRPDWKQYVLARKVAADEIGVARSNYWPMVSLVGNYDVNSLKYSSYDSTTKNWTALLSAQWNIFDGTASWNKVKESEAKLTAQKASEISIKRAVALEVKDAAFNLTSALENLQSTNKAWELAEENYKIADLRYKSGVGTNLDVIDAQVALTQARIEYLQAQHDLQIAKAEINKVVGRKIY